MPYSRIHLTFEFAGLLLVAERGDSLWTASIYSDSGCIVKEWTDVEMSAVLALMASGDDTPLFDAAWAVAEPLFPVPEMDQYRLIP